VKRVLKALKATTCKGVKFSMAGHITLTCLTNHIMKVHYFHEFTCVVEPIWEMTNTNLYYLLY